MDRSVHDLIAFSTPIVYLCVCFLFFSLVLPLPPTDMR